MRCSRCGAPIGNSYVRFNGALLCDNCARELKIDEVFGRQSSLFEQLFPMPGEFASVLGTGSDLDFANTKIRCPRCGTSLRDIESGGQLGCIECYNTFNESVLKNILKRQGSSEYMGRKPGEEADIKLSKVEETEQSKSARSKATDKTDAKVQTVKTEEVKKEPDVSDEELLNNLKNADLKDIPDKELEIAMGKAAKAEDYDLAAKIRDELKSRKEDN